MTLIAGFMKNQCPILIGDLLIANTTDTNKDLVIPTLGKISSRDLKQGEYRPSALSQKVNLLSSKLGLAWSGNLLEAKEFMSQVIGVGLHNNPSRQSILEIYKDISPSDLSILGILRDGKNMTLFDVNSEIITSPNLSFEWFKAAGIGYNSLSKIVPNLHQTITSGKLNRLEDGISAAVQISSRLFSSEFVTGASIKELFGAGYEILHPFRKGLSKFADLAYYFWVVEENEPGVWLLSIPFLVMKYSYQGDILVIRSVRLSTGKKVGVCNIDSDELHVVNPIYRIPKDNELVGYEPPSFNSSMTCNVFFCMDVAKQTNVFSTIGRYVNKTPPIIWRDEFTQHESVDVNSEFLRESLAKISSLFSPSSPE